MKDNYTATERQPATMSILEEEKSLTSILNDANFSLRLTAIPSLFTLYLYNVVVPVIARAIVGEEYSPRTNYWDFSTLLLTSLPFAMGFGTLLYQSGEELLKRNKNYEMLKQNYELLKNNRNREDILE